VNTEFSKVIYSNNRENVKLLEWKAQKNLEAGKESDNPPDANSTHIQCRTEEVVFREDLYPRIKPDPTIIQRYAENIDLLPPIEVNQHNILIDGYHRWTAHRKVEAETIKVTVTQTASETELYGLAIRRNASHGLQMNEGDKKSAAIKLYAAGTGLDKKEVAKILSITERTVSNYLSEIDKQLRKARREKIINLYLSCYTLDEIADVVKVDKATVSREINFCCKLENLPNRNKVRALFQDEEFEPQLYSVWTFAKKTNEVDHFGNSEQRIIENLIYLYTEPFNIVVDVFAGGGATIDVCRKRLRRFWISDRKPPVEREHEIRKLDVTESLPPLNKRWNDVTLTFLDPPYWRQAQGKYSNDPEDLANMPLDQFTDTLAGIVNGIAKKQSKGVIALLMQPTQWNADDKEFTDHVMDIVRLADPKRLKLINRVSCPYSTQQCTPQQVEWAKKSGELLVISRELIIWRIVSSANSKKSIDQGG